MKFTITYRKKDGSMTTEVIDASDRAACIAECRKRGIAPTAVAQGGKASSQSRRNPAWVKGALAGALVVAVACAAWWYLGRNSETPPPSAEKPAKTKVAKPQKPERKHVAKPAAKPVVVAVPEKPKETNYFDKVRADLARVRERMKTASDYSYYNLERKAKDLEKLLTDEKMQFHTTNKANIVEQPFKTCTEQVLDWVFNCEVGGDPPPFVPPLDPGEMANIGEILDRANEVLEGDSEEVAARKVMVERAKKELKEYLAQGGNAADFLHFYYNELQNAYELRLEASKTVRQFAHNEDPETARKYLEETNKKLAEKGIAPVMLSDKTKQRLGIPIEEKEGEKK